MKLFSQIYQKQITTADKEKIIPAKDFSTLKKAADILKEVKKEASQYRQEIAAECETIKQSAYDEGFQQGLEKLNVIILKMEDKLKEVEEELKKSILPIALKAAKKILGEELKSHPDRIVDIIIQAIKPVIQHHRITIYVNKEDVPILEKNRQKIKMMTEQAEFFSIQERTDIERGGCIIETEAGIINAQLENQWRALQTAFENLMSSQ
jgi:type III secretion protein L